ncbi:hypothetical protein [Actinoplanes sp. NPDC049118]|uniref:hypothetical protein n=1 Tax=Actinoplanes sp. NPDC049118 TaxID=3155769 RepID=UPI003410BE7B
MNLSRSRASLMRATGSVVAMAAAALVTALPGTAQATPAEHEGDGERSVSVTVKNHTDVRLNLDDADAAEGEWTIAPPYAIKAFKIAYFASISDEFEGGTEASATYRTKFGKVEFYWSNPWQVDNDFTCHTPPELECGIDSDLGPNAKVTFDLWVS